MNKIMRYVRGENGDLQLHICEFGVWKHYRRVLFVQEDLSYSTPGYRTFQYYWIKLDYELLPSISIGAFEQMSKLKAAA